MLTCCCVAVAVAFAVAVAVAAVVVGSEVPLAEVADDAPLLAAVAAMARVP